MILLQIFIWFAVMAIVGVVIETRRQIMASLADVDAAIADLKTDVDRIVPPGAIDYQPQVDAIAAVKADLDAKFPPQ